MKKITSFIESVYEKLEDIDYNEEKMLEKASIAIVLMENAFDQVKTFISTYSFRNETEEIHFFKVTKPQLFSKLIYYRKICTIETMRPNGSNLMQKNYIHKELDRLKDFFDRNIDFYKYYRLGCTHLDKYYFLRGKSDIQLNQDSFYFERDPKFSTSFDFKVAKLLANEMLSIYLNSELTKLEELSQNKVIEPILFPKIKETWTDSKIELIELIYAIHTIGSINHGKIDLKRLTAYFESVFNIDLGDVYRAFLEMRGRKGSKTQYLDKLREKLIARMNEADNH